jgi:acyl-[acyl-carrier-protein]-phospholipid O-acyltransferase/long-chain-fatty-acid--[acyl-carrier-protein] ligase
MACLLRGKTVVNLNYTASVDALKAAAEKAELGAIYSSRQFLKKLSAKGVELDGLLEGRTVYHLEDLKEEIGLPAKLTTLGLVHLLPAWLLILLFSRRSAIDDPAAILFSSGSEGTPKGVVLSHRNIMGNIKQISDVLNTREDEVIMANLPLFHAFGLTVTGLLPLIEGVPAVCHPDPTDVVNTAKAMARYKATVLCATSTFLRLFARNRRVHPLMLETLRVVIAGAERLSPEVRDAFEHKFRKTIYEGYGTTETTPVAGVNLPDRLDPRDWSVQIGNKAGSVGMALPGSSFRIVDPETLEPLPPNEDGLILIGGTQVMLGYLNDPDRTTDVLVELDGQRWYKSGDKGHLDNDGFLTIVDRYSRFAKIGGEMISLGAVEQAIGQLLPEEIEVLAVALPDGKKGEKVVLLFAGEMDADELGKLIAGSSLNPLMRPSDLVQVEAIPKLGSGKNDYKGAKGVAVEQLGA